MNDAKKIERYRVNDYVGPPIWGFRCAIDVAVGDRLFSHDVLTGNRWYYRAVLVDGKLACRYEDTGRVAGFIHRRKK